MTPFEKVYEVVRRIPRGRVATYGQVAAALDADYSPLFVGWALHALTPEHGDVPWHRVVNAKGGISTRQVLGYAPDLQKLLLVEEGIVFDEADRCDLSQYQWDGAHSLAPDSPPPPRPRGAAKSVRSRRK